MSMGIGDDFEDAPIPVEPILFMDSSGASMDVLSGNGELHVQDGVTPLSGTFKFVFYWDGRGLVVVFSADHASGGAPPLESGPEMRLAISGGDFAGSDLALSSGVLLGIQPTLFGGETLIVQCKPKASVVELRADGSAIKYVIAHLVNVPRYVGVRVSAARHDGHGFHESYGRLLFDSKSWKVTIDHLSSWLFTTSALDDRYRRALSAFQSLREFRTTGGLLITHALQLERSNGAAFSRQQAASALGRLETFLKFAFGGPGQPIFMFGFSHSSYPVWLSLASSPTFPLSESQRSVGSWLPRSSADAALSYDDQARSLNMHLSSAFDYWMERTQNDVHFLEATTRAVEWYAGSLEASGRNQGILLSQASLEVLSNYYLGTRLNLSEKGQQALQFADQLTLVLSSLGIDIQIPRALTTLLGAHLTGPMVVVRARNAVAHPRAGRERFSTEQVQEAQTLALWYAEQIVFRLIRYRGPYWDRIERRTVQSK